MRRRKRSLQPLPARAGERPGLQRVTASLGVEGLKPSLTGRNAGRLLAGRQLLGYYDQFHHLDAADHRQSRFDSNFFSNQRAMEIIDA